MLYKIHKKTPVPDSIFIKVAGSLQFCYKRDLSTGVFL